MTNGCVGILKYIRDAMEDRTGQLPVAKYLCGRIFRFAYQWQRQRRNEWAVQYGNSKSYNIMGDRESGIRKATIQYYYKYSG